MKNSKFVTLLFLTSIITSCTRPADVDPNYYYYTQQLQQSNASLQQQLKQYQDCTCQNTTQNTTTGTKDAKTQTTTKNTDSVKKDETKTESTTPKETENKTETKTEDKAPTETNSSTNETSAKIMEKLLQNIKGANYIEALVDKHEKKLATGEITENQLKLHIKNTGLTKIEVIYSSKASTGTKLLYTHGETKVKVRPNGALSLITTTIDMMDDRLTSSNGWPLNQTDFYGMADRLGSNSYKSEVLGKTTIDGLEVFIVKLSKISGDNEMDARIKHEKIYFDPKTYTVKLWEAYEGENQEPFFKITIKEMKFHTSLDESYFKL